MVEMMFNLLQRPFVQASAGVVLSLLAVFIIRPKTADKTWLIAGLLFIGFMLVNSAFMIMAPHPWIYFFSSLGCSALYLLAIGIVLPALVKILNIEGSGESAMVFIFILYHPVGLLLVLFLKWLYLTLF